MRSSILFASLLPFAFALPSDIEARAAKTDAQKITAAITNIQTNIHTLNSSVTGFNKGDLNAISEVLTIQSQTDDLGKAIQSATSAAKASKQLNADDSLTVGIAVLNLQPDIFSLLDNIVRKKPAFDSAILGVGSVAPQVHQDLVNQKGYSDALGAAITKKLDPSVAGLAPGIIAQIDDAFDKAIKTYSKSGGVFALPPFPDFASFKAALLKAAGRL